MMFEKKDEVTIKPEYLDLYKEMGLTNITKRTRIGALAVNVPKTGRIILIKNDQGVAQVDFWDSSPTKFTIKTEHLDLVSKASDREDVAGEPMGALLSKEDSEDKLYLDGNIEPEDYKKILENREKVKKSILNSNSTMDRHVIVNSAPYKVNTGLLSGEVPLKKDNGKPRMDLVRPELTLGIGQVLGFGAEKYNEKIGETPNYLKGDGFNYSRIIGSLERHISLWKMGIDNDEETDLSHLKHAAANLMFLLTYEESNKGIDDRVKLEKKDV